MNTQAITEENKKGMKMNRLLYLGYYLKQLDRKLFQKFLDFTTEHTGRSKVELLSDSIASVFKYNISILEYFQFRFYELSEEERAAWAGTGFMYEYQLKMNPKDKRGILDDKTLFYKNYSEFFVHTVADRADLKEKPELADRILSNKSDKIVFKAADGKCGAQVEIRHANEFTLNKLVDYMTANNYDLVEEFIIQHSILNQLSPSAVNTIRVITQLDENDQVNVLGCRLRISVNSPVDNMGAGNLGASIDKKTGIVDGPGVFSDISKQDVEVHPVTGVKIIGLQVPYWNEIITMAERSAKKHTQNRSIGWDVVVTENGPGLIEGNHDWCKLLWQLPEKKGMKNVLHQYEVKLNKK